MDDAYQLKLLENWSEVFRQGLLTFWVLVAVSETELSVHEIKDRVVQLTDGTYVTSEQALYRLLRKQYDIEVVNVREVPGDSGPNKKLYSLSELGASLLQAFSTQNIGLFMKPAVQNIINKEVEE